MIEVRDLSIDEIKRLIAEVGFGHLGCARRNVPYVVPIHYAYDDPLIYIYTTEGKKAEILRANPNVCLQIEDVKDNRNWRSVIIDGEAGEMLDEAEKQHAVKLMLEVNPTLTPALSIRWMDNWVRENIEVMFRIFPLEMSGRASVEGSDAPPIASPRPPLRAV